MTIQLSLFTAIILVVIIHTILTHLLNWMWRNADADDNLVFSAIVLSIVEIVALLQTLNYLIP